MYRTSIAYEQHFTHTKHDSSNNLTDIYCPTLLWLHSQFVVQSSMGCSCVAISGVLQ